jgi:hypothetical protein
VKATRKTLRAHRRRALFAGRLAAAHGARERAAVVYGYLLAVAADPGLSHGEACALVDRLTRDVQDDINGKAEGRAA